MELLNEMACTGEESCRTLASCFPQSNIDLLLPSEFTGSCFEVTVFWKTSKWLVLVGILSVLAVPAEALKEVEGFLCDPPLLNFASVWAS